MVLLKGCHFKRGAIHVWPLHVITHTIATFMLHATAACHGNLTVKCNAGCDHHATWHIWLLQHASNCMQCCVLCRMTLFMCRLCVNMHSVINTLNALGVHCCQFENTPLTPPLTQIYIQYLSHNGMQSSLDSKMSPCGSRPQIPHVALLRACLSLNVEWKVNPKLWFLHG